MKVIFNLANLVTAMHNAKYKITLKYDYKEQVASQNQCIFLALLLCVFHCEANREIVLGFKQKFKLQLP